MRPASSLLVIFILSLATASGAFAQTAPAFSWTGFYIGAHAGAGWQSNPGMTLSDTNAVNRLQPLAVSGSSDAAFVGGFHAGYNWQLESPWVVGVEADLSWTDLNSGGTVGPPLYTVGIALVFPNGTLTMSEEVNWLASLRARLGFIAWPNAMLYATGGVAWENVDYKASLLLPSVDATSISSSSQTNTGFTIGGGVEWRAFSNILLRAEYLYYGFGNDRIASAAIVTTPPGLQPLPVNYGWSSNNVQVFRIAASYKF